MSLLRLAASQSGKLLLRPLPAAVLSGRSSTSSTHDNYFVKNEKLGRPVSPWMIYRPQLTSMLSITHRGTGLGLGVLLYAWGLNSLITSNNWAGTLETLSATVPSSLVYTLKVLVATSVGYHTFNGLRHLAWDVGYGFTLRELYTSGYVVLAITFIVGWIALSKA